MSVNLQKGQKVDLTKGNSSLSSIMVGLGWDAVDSTNKGGFFSQLLGSKEDIDCDATAFLCVEGKVIDNDDVVYFGNLTHYSGTVRHMGDNLTGEGDGDDEQILVDLKRLPNKYNKIVFVVNIYKASERRQHFGMIRNAFIRLVDVQTNRELCKYNLSENYEGKTAMIFGEIYRYQNEWKFSAIGQATNDNDIASLLKRYI